MTRPEEIAARLRAAVESAKWQVIEGECSKCGFHSGDDWRQCRGVCPVPGSPHYVAGAQRVAVKVLTPDLSWLLAERDRLLGEVERLHERLEDNRVYVMGDGGQMVRQAVEPGSIPDGIDARDETIRGLDTQVARLKAERDTAYARGVEDAAGAVEKRAAELGRQECCGHGVGGHGDGPPECCGDPLLMIADTEAAAAIRALAPGGAT
jgi:hypothetical protein